MIVLTRPLDDSEDYAAELKSEGYECFIEPMLSVSGVAFQSPDFDNYHGIIATSANALKMFEAGSEAIKRKDIMVYCVGKYTAQCAKAMGFTDVQIAEGTGRDLLRYITSLEGVVGQSLLHICGAHVAFPIVDALNEKGFNAHSLVVYETLKAKQFSNGFISALRSGGIDAITFFSKRTAEAFVECVRRSESESLFSSIKVLSISASVLECVRVLPWGASYVSETADRAGIMKLLKAYVPVRRIL